jgi:hypothetical protein
MIIVERLGRAEPSHVDEIRLVPSFAESVIDRRETLLEGMLHRVQRQLSIQQRLEFRVVDLLGLDLAAVLGLKARPATEVSLMPDGICPESAPPGAMTRTLTLDQFLAHRVAVLNGTQISVADAIRFLANQDGAVHYDSNPDAEAQRLRAMNRSLQIMNIDALMSCVRGVAQVLLATVAPIRAEILRRFTPQRDV